MQVKIVTADLPQGRLGMSICYDLRFPNLYRKLSRKELFFNHSAALLYNRKIHWHALVKAEQ